MDNRKPGSRKPKNDPQRRKRMLRTLLFTLLVAAIGTGEYFAVYAAYENMARRKALQLWDCGGSIEANRREPDPTYVEPVLPDVPDSLFDDFPEDDDIVDFSDSGDETVSAIPDTLEQA